MKMRLLFVLLFVIYDVRLFAQSVGIGSSSFTPEAMLEVRGTGTTNATKAFYVQNSTPTYLLTVLNDGNVGIGTNAPAQQLELTKNMRMPATTATVGIIYSGTNRYIHHFGTNNFFAGVTAGNLTLTGVQSVGVGTESLSALVEGNYNTALGYQALKAVTYSSENVAIGNEALETQSYDHSTTATATRNTAVGFQALKANQPTSNANGYYNTAVGAISMLVNTTGYFNTALGTRTLQANTTGISNTALGNDALFSNVSDHYNTAVGATALILNNGGEGNTAVGLQAIYNNATGDYNTGIGVNALYYNVGGTNNTAIGTGAGATAGITGATNSTFLGYNAAIEAGAGNLTNVTAIGSGATVSASNSLVLGASANVGIGTTAPDHKLHVRNSSNGATLDLINIDNAGTGDLTGASIVFNLGGSQYGIVKSIYRTTGGALDFMANGTTPHVSINPDGNLGIGTTTVGSKLQVRSFPTDIGAFSATTTGSFMKSANHNGGSTPAGAEAVLTLARDGVGGQAYANFADFKISRYENSGTTARTQLDLGLTYGDGDATTTNIMTWRSSGNVGIGSSAPAATLDVAGSIASTTFMNADMYRVSNYASITSAASLTNANMQSASYFPVSTAGGNFTVTMFTDLADAGISAADVGRKFIIALAISGNTLTLALDADLTLITRTAITAGGLTIEDVGDYFECFILSTDAVVCTTYEAD